MNLNNSRLSLEVLEADSHQHNYLKRSLFRRVWTAFMSHIGPSILSSIYSYNYSGFADRRPAKPVLKQGTRKKIYHHDGRKKHPPPFMGAQFSFRSFFSRFGPMSDFFVSQKVFSRQNSMLLAWLEVISHYQLSSPVHW